MTELNVHVRHFDENCIRPFIELAETYYPAGHDARNPAYLRWAFLRNPFGIGRVAFATSFNGRWSAVMGVVPFRIRWGPKRLLASMVVNVLVHPEHRGEGLFIRMIEAARTELSTTNEWLLGHPNEAAIQGWKRTGMCFRPGYDVRVVPPLLGRLSSGGSRLRSSTDPLLSLDFTDLSAWQASLTQPVIEATPAFLRWRFLEHPTRAYRVFLELAERRIIGYRADRAFRSTAVRWSIDWQGARPWALGPARSPLPSLFAWPTRREAPRGSYTLPRFRKHYEFFATPCATKEHDGDAWEHLTLAASDFA